MTPPNKQPSVVPVVVNTVVVMLVGGVVSLGLFMANLKIQTPMMQSDISKNETMIGENKDHITVLESNNDLDHAAYLTGQKNNADILKETLDTVKQMVVKQTSAQIQQTSNSIKLDAVIDDIDELKRDVKELKETP